MDKLFELVKKLIADRFFGSLENRFENGKIVYLRKSQTIKVEYTPCASGTKQCYSQSGLSEIQGVIKKHNISY
jgi:hypothetical protein